MKRLPAAAMICVAMVCPAWSAEPTPAASREIEHLLSYVESSGCQFYRNGSWYSGNEARSHLQQKYDYLLKKGQISTAESFVQLGATSSSMSGEAYQVRCAGDAKPRPAAGWFSAELQRYRGAGR